MTASKSFTHKMYNAGENLKAGANTRFDKSYKYFNGAERSLRLYADQLASKDIFHKYSHKHKDTVKSNDTSNEVDSIRDDNMSMQTNGIKKSNTIETSRPSKKEMETEELIALFTGATIIGSSSFLLGVMVQSESLQLFGFIVSMYAGMMGAAVATFFTAMFIGQYAAPAALYSVASLMSATENVLRYVDYCACHIAGEGIQKCAELLEDNCFTPTLAAV